MASTILAFISFSVIAWAFEKGNPERQSASVLVHCIQNPRHRRSRDRPTRQPPVRSRSRRTRLSALLDAISEGSLSPGAQADSGRDRQTTRRLAATGAAGAAPAEEGRPGARRSRPRRGGRPARCRPDRPGLRSARRDRCAGRPPRRRTPRGARSGAGRGRQARRPRQGRQGHDRSRHRLPQRDLRSLRQPADRRERPSPLGAPAPRDGRLAAIGAAARGDLGRARRDRRGNRRRRADLAAELIDRHALRASDT